MISYPIQYPRPGGRKRPERTAPVPPVPPAANVIEVTGSFGDDQTVWTFDQPVTIESGATWGMFTLHEDGGAQERTGVSATQLSPTTIRVTMNAPPEDLGNGWFWILTSIPPKVKTSTGADVTPGAGDLQLS
jgi:hypothetical protein